MIKDKEYIEKECEWVPVSEDGFSEEGIAVCPKKHEMTVHEGGA